MIVTKRGGHTARFLHRSNRFVSALIGIAGLAVASFAPTQAYAVIDPGTSIDLPGNPNQIINIWCTIPADVGCTAPYTTGTTADGTIFTASPNPSQPSTGTGVFQPFLRTQRGSGTCNVPDSTGKNGCTTVNGNLVNNESGFNTDVQNQLNFDTKAGTWTRAVTMSEFEILPGGYIILSLDANQLGQAQQDVNKIVITQMEIFIGPNLSSPEASCASGTIQNTGYKGTQFDADTGQTDDKLCGQSYRWSLDQTKSQNGNGDVDVVLQASICDTNGQCGSGHGDLNVFVPVSHLGSFSPTDNFVLYVEYLYANDGFEEWKFSDTPGQITSVPEPGTLGLLGIGLTGFGWMRRRKKSRSALG